MTGRTVPARAAGAVLFILLAVLAVLAACAPIYDEQTDKQIAAVQQETDAGLVKLITLARRIDRLKEQPDPASRQALAEATLKAGYEANAEFYDKVDSDLTSLELRMTATPDLSAAKLGEAIKALRDNIDDLRTFHADHGTIGAKALVRSRAAVNEEFKTLMHYELNLKSGKQAASS